MVNYIRRAPVTGKIDSAMPIMKDENKLNRDYKHLQSLQKKEIHSLSG